MARKTKIGKRSAMRKGGAKRPKRVVVVKKKKVVREPKARIPRDVLRRDPMEGWLVMAKRDPWNCKPPPLGVRGEPSLVCQLRYRAVINPTGSVAKFVMRPHSAYFFGQYVGATDNANDVLGWSTSLNQTQLAAMMYAARPLAGGLKVTPTFAATVKPGWTTSCQQATSKLTSGWINVLNNTVNTTASLLTGISRSPEVATAGVPIIQLWHDEDLEDTQMDSDIVNTAVPSSTCNHPQSVMCFSGIDTSTSLYVDAILWIEGALKNEVAAVFGNEADKMRIVNPAVLLDAEEKVPDNHGVGDSSGYFASAASAAGTLAAIAVGSGFGKVMPGRRSMTSGASPYN